MAHNTFVAMMTVTGRAKAADETLASFAQASVPIDHVQLQTEPPSLRMNGINFIRTLRAAIPHGKPVLVVEDDLIASSTLGPWLEWIEAQNFTVPVFLYVNQARWHSSAAAQMMADGGPTAPAGVEPVAQLNTWWGTQATWFPVDFVHALLLNDRIRWEADELSAFDLELRNILLDQRITPLVTVPHLVQHRDYPRITGGGAQHSSHAFRDGVMPPATISEPVVEAEIKPVKRAKNKEN
jgi:hypothetical protein